MDAWHRDLRCPLLRPVPDFEYGECDDCGRRDRLFMRTRGEWLCRTCYRELVEAILETREGRQDQ